jgi:hypothetical protein
MGLAVVREKGGIDNSPLFLLRRIIGGFGGDFRRLDLLQKSLESFDGLFVFAKAEITVRFRLQVSCKLPT